MVSILHEYYLAKTNKCDTVHVMAYFKDKISICGEDFSQYKIHCGIRLLDKYISTNEAEEYLCKHCDKILINNDEIAPCWALHTFYDIKEGD